LNENVLCDPKLVVIYTQRDVCPGMVNVPFHISLKGFGMSCGLFISFFITYGKGANITYYYVHTRVEIMTTFIKLNVQPFSKFEYTPHYPSTKKIVDVLKGISRIKINL
jgi:hypothetical protein